jgi:hypothetical protein
MPEAFQRALAQGTRAPTGAPGPRYWQQWADYRLEADLNPVSKRLTGSGVITYHNRSPDTLHEVYLHLLHNIFAPNSRHNTDVPWAVEGIDLSRVAAQGQELKATEVVALRLDEASAKVRTGPPVDAPEDYALPVWAGEIPLHLAAGDPLPDDRCTAPLPEYLGGEHHGDV